MKPSFILLKSLAIVFVGAIPTFGVFGSDIAPINVELDYFDEQGNAIDISDHYHNHSTMEMWLGSNPTNVGDLKDGNLYHAIWQSLNTTCPDNDKHLCAPGSSTDFTANYPQQNGKVGLGKTTVFVHGAVWPTNQIRKLLFGAVAGAVEGMANEPQNCYDAHGRKFCNVSDRVKVYLPDAFIHVQISSSARKSTFDCCGSRDAVDKKVDELKIEVESAFEVKDKTYRIVRCIGGTGGC